MTRELIPQVNLTISTQDGSAISVNRNLVGILLKKSPNHYCFEEETRVPTYHTRHPKVWDSKHISVVRRKDNSLKFSFKELKSGFDPEKFAFEVYEEINKALKSIKA